MRDPLVMGRLATWVTATLLGLVGVAQLAGLDASRAIASLDSGPANFTWSVALILGGTFVTGAYMVDDAYSSMVLEVAGVGALLAGVAVYVGVIIMAEGISGSAFVLALSTATVVNCAGRTLMLFRRMKWVRKASA